jgi:hypothetical protein
MPTLAQTATVVRSKNAGPLTLSFDLMFPDRAAYDLAAGSDALKAARIAALYGVPEALVAVIPYPVANAIKIALPRRVVAGSPGDRDVYGAQQHAPLLGLEL